MQRMPRLKKDINRHSPDDIQFRKYCTTIPPPRALHSFGRHGLGLSYHVLASTGRDGLRVITRLCAAVMNTWETGVLRTMLFNRSDQLDEPSQAVFIQGHGSIGVEQLSPSNLVFHEFGDPDVYRLVAVEVECDQCVQAFEIIAPRQRYPDPMIDQKVAIELSAFSIARYYVYYYY